MSLTAVRPYFRAVMNELGFKEWKDGFNWQNNPSSILDGSYHLEMQEPTGIKQNQDAIEMSASIVVRLFIKGFSDPAGGIDKAIQKTQSVITKALKASRRTTGDLKNVGFQRATWQPFGESNDNIVIAEIEFETLIILSPDAA